MECYRSPVLANTVYGANGGTWNSAKIPYAEFVAKDENREERFHVWRMDWDEASIKLYLDGRLLNETDTTRIVDPDGFNPFRPPHHVLLNSEIGSNGGDPSATGFPSRYEIDYVRVYRRKG